MRITPDRFVKVLGQAPKPRDVWQKQFDYNDHALVQMAQMDWDSVPDNYMRYYLLDLAYVELQPDLFRHLFPACLKFWYETLMRDDSAGYGDIDFHYSLIQGQILDTMLVESERQSLYHLFCDGMLDRIEAERGFVCSEAQTMERLITRAKNADFWISRFNTLGIVAPVINHIWEHWWKLDHPGKAFSAVTYGSGLVYQAEENPVFAAWSAAGRGRGGPFLSEIDGSIYDRAWQEDNLAFLRTVLSVDSVIAGLGQAASALSDFEESALAERVASDAKTRRDFVEIRIGALLENLSRVQLSQENWD